MSIGGSITLTPTFDPSITAYTANTGNASNKVTAEATDSGDTVTILNGSTPVTSGQNATWSEGSNTLIVTVADRDDSTNTTTYTVTVTYTPPEE